MLAVVEDEEEPPVDELRDEHRARPLGRSILEPESADDRGGHAGRLADLGEGDEGRAVAVMTGQIPGRPEGETCLAHATRARERHETRLAEVPADGGELRATADEARQLGWQMTRALGDTR
jgi:hypothetical protein